MGRYADWLRQWGLNRAVLLAMLGRGWQFLSGPVTLLLIARCFSPDVQGYYYTMVNLVGLQTLVELGMATVMVNLASHHWALLSWQGRGELTGDDVSRRRLAALSDQMQRWYGGLTILFIVAVGLAGDLLLSAKASAAVQFRGPWWLSVAAAAGSLLLSPRIALLEGGNLLVPVYGLRLGQGIAGTMLAWTLIAGGAELWTVSATMIVKFLAELILVQWWYGRLFIQLRMIAADRLSQSERSDWSWKGAVWPLQSRVALFSVVQYLGNSLTVPVLFYYQGPAIAGRMGMTWNLLTTLQSTALAWVQIRTAELGMLRIRREYTRLETLFRRITIASALLTAAGLAVVFSGILLLNRLPDWVAAWTQSTADGAARTQGSITAGLIWVAGISERLADRFLDLKTLGLYCLVIALMHLPACLMAYARSRGEEPFLPIAIACNVTMGGLVWWWGRQYGVVGTAWGTLLPLLVISLPGYLAIWSQRRRSWDKQDATSPAEDDPARAATAAVATAAGGTFPAKNSPPEVDPTGPHVRSVP